MTPDDIRTLAAHHALGAPKPPTNPLARLMQSARGALILADLDFRQRDRNERLKRIRLKARRAKELREAFS